MKKLIYLLAMLPLVFTYSCVSMSEYQRLKFEFEQLKNDSENQYAELHNDMALFKEAYNPELQEVFSENVLAAEKYRESIEEIKNDVDDISYKIENLLRESENDRVLISENLKTSTAENVVNEFRQLNNQWEATIFELTNLVRNSEKAVESSHRAAIQAAEKAGSAERSADYAVESMNRIDRHTKSLGKIQERIKDLEFKIQKISKQLNKIEEPKRNKKRDQDK
jgi:methyl-accepting chemotaxis protein